MWFGNTLIKPQDGKRFIQDVPATKTQVQDAVAAWDGKPDNDKFMREMGPVCRKSVPDCISHDVTIPKIFKHPEVRYIDKG